MAVNIFERIGFDWILSEPDLGQQNVTSNLACAIICSTWKCVALDVLPMGVGVECQMSNRKGSCMERKDGLLCPGSRIYQKKVINIYIERLIRRIAAMNDCCG
jgi:hypothetical protein